MAKFEIATTPEAQAKVYEVLKQVQGKTIAVAAIAKLAKMNSSKVRYVILDLIDLGKVKRKQEKAFNEHYIRYSYEILSAL